MIGQVDYGLLPGHSSNNVYLFYDNNESPQVLIERLSNVMFEDGILFSMITESGVANSIMVEGADGLDENLVIRIKRHFERVRREP